MGLFSSIGEGWKLFRDSIEFLFKKPIFLAPVFFSWIVFASVVLYTRYYFNPPSVTLELVYFFLLIFLVTFVICLANIVMLEFMQQIESGEKVSFSKALKEVIGMDMIRVIPIALIWAALWFIIIVLRALTRKKGEGKKPEPSARDAARTLGGAEGGPFSWRKLGLDMLEKLVRMAVFLALPAIAWENKGSFSAFGKSIDIIKRHPVQFLTTYTLTGVAAVIMALPLVPIFILDDFGVTFSAAFWTGVIIYEAVVWTFGIYLEQMSAGLLYLWHLKWVRNGSKGELSSVPKPDLFDEVYELKQQAIT